VHVGAVGLEGGRRGDHFDAFFDAGDFEPGVDAPHRGGLDADALLHQRLEPGDLERDGVDARDEIAEEEHAAAVGDGGLADAGLVANDPDGGARHEAAGRIDDVAGQGAVEHLRTSVGRADEDDGEDGRQSAQFRGRHGEHGGALLFVRYNNISRRATL